MYLFLIIVFSKLVAKIDIFFQLPKAFEEK